MAAIPRDPQFDSTLAVGKEGYPFIPNRVRELGSDIFQIRLMGEKTVCIHGREAAQVFYDAENFQRSGAVPRRVVTSLFGKNALHVHDGTIHCNRKTAFLSLMHPPSIQRLLDCMMDEWRSAIDSWQKQPAIVVLQESQKVLTAGACAWAEIPVSKSELPKRAAQLSSMVDAFGGIGPRLWRGKFARHWAQKWAMKSITAARAGQLNVSSDCALAVMAELRQPNGKLLDTRTAAIELLNVIRPTVAISWYIAFSALALHEYPEWRKKIQQDSSGTYLDWFMQEIRRFYPFAPFLGARVKKAFEWNGYKFEKGTLVLLDIYGTNRDARLWDMPGEFRPERFDGWRGDPFALIPQGGGDYWGHRCPGEWITMHNAALAIHVLSRCLNYRVKPGQDLSVDLRRMPTAPKSGFIITDVQGTPPLAEPRPREPSASAAKMAEEFQQRFAHAAAHGCPHMSQKS